MSYKQMKRWIYLGYDKETIEKQRKNIDIENLNTLKKAIIIFIIMCPLILIFYRILDRDIKESILFGVFLIACLGLLFLSKYIPKKDNIPSGVANILISIATISIYSFTIYFGTFKAENDLAVTIIWMFLFMQVMFTCLPINNLISTVPMAIIFIFCSYITKDFNKTIYDIFHTIIVLCVGCFMSWNKSKLKLDYLIAQDKLQEKNEVLYYDSITDVLTGLYNRKKIFDSLFEIGEKCIKENRRMVCLIMDIDDFKIYNDLYGHPAGDQLLKKIGQTLKTIAIKNEISIGRIGGEEFIAIWQENNHIKPKDMAEKIKRAIEVLKIQHKGSKVSDIVTISQGLSVLSFNEICELKNSYTVADEELYKAKKNGKNCYCIKELG